MSNLNDPLSIGWQFHQRRDFVGAEALYRRALETDPDNANAWCFLGILYYDLARFEDSVQSYQRALKAKPEFPVALSNLANSLGALGRFDEAESSVRRALALNPGYPTAWNNLGALLVKQGKFEEATETFEKSLELIPDNESVHRNLGAVLIRQGKLAEGARYSESALRLNPGSAEAHRNRAIVWLLTGNFAQGWEEYEWRFLCGDHGPSRHSQPMWDGQPFPGQTLLLFAEQGLGDTIHFLRYAEMARTRGGRVLVECQSPLRPLLETYLGADQLIARGDPLPPFDLQLPLMSAPRVFGTDLESIPARVPYLKARPDLIGAWRARLDRAIPRDVLRVGLVWQGSTDHHADRQRSIPLAEFSSLATERVRFISLQKGEGTRQISQHGGKLALLDFGDELDGSHGPFLDTAAILANIDLLITIDTSVAHLAGALGVPTWLLLSQAPDWRWLLQRDDSPWYPSFRLFRQERGGDWKSVLQSVRDGLLHWTAQREKCPPAKAVPRSPREPTSEFHRPVFSSVGLSPGRCLDLLAELECQLEFSPEKSDQGAPAAEVLLVSSRQHQFAIAQRDGLTQAFDDYLCRVQEVEQREGEGTAESPVPETSRAKGEEAEVIRQRLREIHGELHRRLAEPSAGEGSEAIPEVATTDLLRERVELIRRADWLLTATTQP